MTKHIALFQSQEIRKIWHDEQWFFSVVDVVQALTESTDPKDYWYRMKNRVKSEEGIELSTICRQLKLVASNGISVITGEFSTKKSIKKT